ncbi:uncharacterized protein AUP68_05740 [Ilyonectria robusta]
MSGSPRRSRFRWKPAAQVKWAAWDSSKYCYAILKIFECVVAGDRLLIYVQNPITSQILNALLVLASFGVNFHKACHHGLIMESVSNLSTEVQATGRTWRIGQMYKVVWKRLLCADYYDCDRRVWVRASILPDNQDLAIICQEPGIDVRSLRVNPYDPKMVAKPPQVPDPDWPRNEREEPHTNLCNRCLQNRPVTPRPNPLRHASKRMRLPSYPDTLDLLPKSLYLHSPTPNIFPPSSP